MILDTDQYLTVNEFAAAVGASHQAVRHYMHENRLPYVKFVGRYYIDKSQLGSWPPPYLPMGRPKRKKSDEPIA